MKTKRLAKLRKRNLEQFRDAIHHVKKKKRFKKKNKIIDVISLENLRDTQWNKSKSRIFTCRHFARGPSRIFGPEFAEIAGHSLNRNQRLIDLRRALPVLRSGCEITQSGGRKRAIFARENVKGKRNDNDEPRLVVPENWYGEITLPSVVLRREVALKILPSFSLVGS